MLLTVLFALVLLLVGLGSKVRWRQLRWVVTGFAGAILVLGAGVLSTFPVH